MPDTIRQKIVDAIESRFSLIAIGSGYKTNIGSNVTVWRATPFEEDEEGLDIRDIGGPIEQRLANVHEQTLHVEVFAATAESTTAASIRAIIADIYKAIGTDRKWNDGSQDLARNTMLTEDAMAVTQKGNRVGEALVKFDVIYRTNEFDADTRA